MEKDVSREKNKHAHILIVDDSPFYSRMFMELLAESGVNCSISEAANSIEALTKFKEFSPGIVILDLKLNNETGIHLIRPFKRINEKLILIVLTNYPDEHYMKKCIENGADFFFSKYSGTEAAVEICRKQFES